MNKRIFTLLTAGLLLGGSAFNAVNAQVAQKAAVSYASNETALSNGVQFYLGASNSTLYKVTSVLTTKDGKKVVSLGANDGTVEDAQVFALRNYSSRTFELWAKVGNTSYQVVTNADGTLITDASGKKLSELNTKFVVKDGKFKFSGLYTVALPSVEVGSGLKAFSYSTPFTAKELNEYNSNGTTFSFDYSTSELVGNMFSNLKTVTLASDVSYTTTSGEAKAVKAGTYFLKGDDKKVKNFIDEVNAGTNAEATVDAASEISFLALDPSNRYDINGKKDGEGYALYWMKGSVAVANADSCNNASFTINALDVLNQEGLLSLEVSYTKKDEASSKDVYVAAVKPSVSDSKTYVTSVLKSGSDYKNYAHAQLGANSYLDASVLLKKNAENVVNIYFTSDDKSQQDLPAAQRVYHKYLTIDAEDGINLEVLAYNSIDFTMPVAQWIVSDFDGKYTFTLTNRETGKDLVLKLQPNGAENGYKVENATYDGSAAEIAAGQGVTTSRYLNGTSVKFNTIATTRTDGYFVFNETHMKDGVKATFNGKDALFGSKALYAIVEGTTTVKTVKVTSDIENLNSNQKVLVVYPERVKGSKDHSVKALREVEDYVISTKNYAYLNDKNEVAFANDKDTLVVPTYILRTTEETGDNAEYLNQTNAKATKDNATEFAMFKNAAGGYSLALVKNTVDGLSDYSTVLASEFVTVTTSTLTLAESVKHYDQADYFNAYYANVVVSEANPFNPSLAAKPRHASFDNILGSINYQLNDKGINEGILSAESMIFWLDTANSADKTPAFYISKGAEVAEGEQQPAERMFMFNSIDSLKHFVEGTAQEYIDKKYYLEGTNVAKVIFRPATLTGVDTVATTVNGKAVNVTKVVKADGSVNTDALDNFKFHITLADNSDSEYVLQSKRNNFFVYALNGKLGLTNSKDIAMKFTLGTDVPTANESIEAESSVKVLGANGSVVVLGAAGKNVTVATVLGKTVASQVIASDNATIAAPAGVVFVTVDGETTKVVVK